MKCSAAMALILAALAVLTLPAAAVTLRGAHADRLPGAGMTPKTLTPFETAYMDGYFPAGCVDDYMYIHGDKFGDNRYEYKLGQVSNVSIVHYSLHVAKEDRKPMTHETCFGFCRSVPHMSFFGLVNGGNCYCMPYYQSVEGDSSMCDVPCEGNPTTMCGGKTKSSVFGMHMCETTAGDLSAASGKMANVSSELTALAGEVNATWEAMQSGAAAYQQMFGKVGDPAASDLMQAAKVRAGELQKAAGIAGTASADMAALKTTADGMAGSNFSGSAALKSAEETIGSIRTATLAGERSVSELEQLIEETSPNISVAGAGKQYYPIMYFVDKAHVDVPSTCSGGAAHTPMVGSFDACARACDGEVHTCVGFSFFPPTGSMQEGLCFLLSDFETAKYYTGCGSAATTSAPPPPAMMLLQRADKVQCVAKFSKFSGTSLKPDPSGKCKECFKEVEEAARCFQ